MERTMTGQTSSHETAISAPPAATRRLLVGFLLTVAALIGLAGAASAATHADAEESFAAKINEVRAAAGLAPLAVDVQLTQVARAWSGVMAGEDTLYHNPHFAEQVTSDWTRVGENVGTSIKTGAGTAELVARLHDAFVASPPHHANILGDYSQVGVGVVVTDAGKMWVTVNFAKATVPAYGALDEAVRVSQRVFADAAADYVVLGRAEVFADSLGGAGLAGDDAPVLFTPGPSPIDPDPVLHPRVRGEIDRVLGGGATVYLLGGPSAVSPAVADELAADGYDVRRLAGASRVETSVAVAREIVARHGASGEVLLARADDWADAVTGGAYAAYAGSPVVLTGRDALHPATAAFLAELNASRRWALGGRAALADEVVAAAGATRVAGADRSATAVAIAEQLWHRTVAARGDTFVFTPGWSADGWGYALAYAPWSATEHGPALLVGEDLPPAVAAYLDGLGYGSVVPGAAETASSVPAPVVERLRAAFAS
jgi:uncharacterized protein YkwD